MSSLDWTTPPSVFPIRKPWTKWTKWTKYPKPYDNERLPRVLGFLGAFRVKFQSLFGVPLPSRDRTPPLRFASGPDLSPNRLARTKRTKYTKPYDNERHSQFLCILCIFQGQFSSVFRIWKSLLQAALDPTLA